MFRSLLPLFFIFLLFSCSTGMEIEPIDLSYVFNGSNSKVWMIDDIRYNNQSFAPHERRNRDIIVFYTSGKVLLGRLNEISNKRTYGTYEVDSKKRTIKVKYKNITWNYRFSWNENDEITLKPINRILNKYDLILIPFPEI